MASSSQSFWEEALEIAETIDPPPAKRPRYELSPDTPDAGHEKEGQRHEPSSPLGFGGTELTFIPTHLRTHGATDGLEAHSYLQRAEYAANSFGDIASYMKNKDKKVQTQNRELAAASNLPQVFKGLTFYINGNTKPSMEDLRKMIVQRGGTVVPFLRRKRELDYVVAPVLTIAKFKELENYRVVREGFVLESVEREKVVDWRKWRLRAGNEQGLAGFVAPARSEVKKPLSIEQEPPQSCEPTPRPEPSPVTIASLKVGGSLLRPLRKPSAPQRPAPPPVKASPAPAPRPSVPAPATDTIKVVPVEPRTTLARPLKTAALPPSKAQSGPVPTPLQSVVLPDSSSFSPAKSKATPARVAAPEVLVVPPTAEQLSQRDNASPLLRHSSPTPHVSPNRPRHGIQAPEGLPYDISYRSKEANRFAGRLMQDDDFRAMHTAERGNEAGFIDSYYQNSRLHLLSTWKTELRLLVAEARSSAEHVPTVLPSQGSEKVIFHVDFDAFFVSVGLAKRPDLKGKPVVVCHSSGGGRASTSEIASASYEARAKGVKNGMSLGRARELCGDDLATIPYEFDTYRKHSTAFYRILLGYADELEAVSIDEALLEVTGAVTAREMAPDEAEAISPDPAVCVAEQIRSDIRDATGCEVSIGISHNILLARLATRKAKPGGVYRLTTGNCDELLSELDVKSLPSVGHSMQAKLQDAFGTTKCGDLLAYSKQRLRGVLGPKTGDTIYNFLRGIDDRKLTPDKERKSVSAEMNYGIRFKNQDQALHYLQDLAVEVSKRLKAINVKGRHMTLKIMHRHPEAPVEAPKFLGHGWCETYNRSVGIERRGQATDDATIIGEEAVKLLKAMRLDPTELRGVGIQITKLDHGPKQAEVEKGQGRLSFAKPDRKGKGKEVAIDDGDDAGESVGISSEPSPIPVPGEASPQPVTEAVSPAPEPREVVPVLPTQLDPDFLAALPVEIRQEIQEEHTKRHGSRSGSRSASRSGSHSPLPSPGPSRKSTLNPAAHITKQLRPKHKTQLDAAMIAQGALYGAWSRADAQTLQPGSAGPSRGDRSRSVSLAPSDDGEMVGKYRAAELRALGIDVDVFSALPEDVQAEVILQERQKARNLRLRTHSASPAKVRPPRQRSPQPVPTISIPVRSKPALFGAREADDVAAVLAKWVESREEGPNERDTDRVLKYLCKCLGGFSGLDHVSQLLRDMKGVIRDVCAEDSAWWDTWHSLFHSIDERVREMHGTGLRVD
ncbi:hypothetical protein A1Q1_06663 [Trichosporon asahii var. asahii CBS 2479]|uniref:DNA repair protein REV1 n=1 Tax=Trichosporon asahii var. asahii (strain ATCC 90039 / CBS 2479 / JCM 2466 / KCTC 7840 / NBRC 103889/ NCYC 2677 / UAMH 7654) TaxID=1186058 RepID=J4UJX1_TRIAS|nr:hypothetical protein A1Q1_06663 [Trichosporon asahii var. asahii CBS 2479]EJT52125.1 hypothetical protein A1Q1_06663 [Trichosporon asahii var. asahii CBS 2479]